jgi:hypothetical protein
MSAPTYPPTGPAPVREREVEHRDNTFSVRAPFDRVRWASVLAGLVTTLSALAVLAVLGLAIGLSSFDASNPQSFGIGAGLYGGLSAIIAFVLGGFVSAKTAAVAGTWNGILNGAMVWLVAIPLIVNVLTTGVGTLLGVATEVTTAAAGAAAEVVAPVIDTAAEQAAQNPALQPTVEAAATEAVSGVQEAIQDVQAQVESIEPEDVERVVQDVGGAAWAALLALGLTAGAAILGGYLGRRSEPTDIAVYNLDSTGVRR